MAKGIGVKRPNSDFCCVDHPTSLTVVPKNAHRCTGLTYWANPFCKSAGPLKTATRRASENSTASSLMCWASPTLGFENWFNLALTRFDLKIVMLVVALRAGGRSPFQCDACWVSSQRWISIEATHFRSRTLGPTRMPEKNAPKSQQPPSLFRLFRNRFIAGLFVVLPIYITYALLKWLYDLLYSNALQQWLHYYWSSRWSTSPGCSFDRDCISSSTGCY